ncbi:MAG: radical SAM protein [Anaerolineae bacterium]|nr:radical SAM protein [Anaerolineae bacterium]
MSKPIPQINYDDLRRQYPKSPEPWTGNDVSGRRDLPDPIRENLGSRRVPKLSNVRFPDADPIVAKFTDEYRQYGVDVLLVNPPSPDGGIWIRSQHRVGRRSRENMIWGQVSLAQMAAVMHPDYTVHVIDAIAERMSWPEFEKKLRELKPRFYVTQMTAPTLTNDNYGCFLAKSIGAITIAFGTHVTPLAVETMRPHPSLDLCLRGEPEVTLREVVDTITGQIEFGEETLKLYKSCHEDWEPKVAEKLPNSDHYDLTHVKGLVWRRGQDIVRNPDRNFIPNLDDLPLPMHHLLPLDKYRTPVIKGTYQFIVTSRGCTAGCIYCIKHVSYQAGLRLRSPENVVAEIEMLVKLGVSNIHMYADLFTANRDQVIGICKLIVEKDLKITFTCNSRVDYIDEEMLQWMAKAGCTVISWGIESANEEILKKARKGTTADRARQSVGWANKYGIRNLGYFIVGLPGETRESIQETIDFSKTLPLDLAIFHIAAPYPGTPFFFMVMENNWFRPGTRWEQVDMDQSTVLQYSNLSAEDLEKEARRAMREWMFRPGPIFTYLKSLRNIGALQSAFNVAFQQIKWTLFPNAAH